MKKISEFCLNNIKHITLIYVLILVIINLFFVIRGDDFHFHMMRLNAIADEYRVNGLSAFPMRIYSTVLDGYGYASPMFYSDIFMQPFALLTLLGFSVLSAYRLMKVCVLIATYFISVKVSKKLYDNSLSADIFVAVYMMSVTVYSHMVGSAIGRSFAVMFVPLAIAGLYMIMYKGVKYDWLYLGVGVAGLFLSNVLDCIIVVFALAVIFIFNFRVLEKKSILKIFQAIVVFFGLTLWFILPMLEQMDSQIFFVTSKKTSQERNDLSCYTVPFLGLLLPVKYYNIIQRLFGFPTVIAYMNGLLVFIFVAAIALRKHKVIIKDRFMITILGLLVFFIWFQTKLFPFGLVKNIVGTMQFPYRVGIVMAIISSFLCVKLIEISQNKKIITLVLLMSFYFIVLNLMSSVGLGIARVVLKGGEYMDYSYSMNDIMGAEYLPEKLMTDDFKYDKVFINEHKDKVACANNATVVDFKRSKNYFEVSFANNDDVSRFEIPIIMYKGYEAFYADSGEKLPIYSSENGLIEFKSKRSAATVQIKYNGTLIQCVSNVISLLFCVCLAGYILARHIKDRRCT